VMKGTGSAGNEEGTEDGIDIRQLELW
jgi:hypothetical protein